jgi:ATP-dependent protease HslVU (ClpYQ) ATPase subunit
MERILEDISFEADTLEGKVEITNDLIDTKLSDLVKSEDTTRYIL